MVVPERTMRPTALLATLLTLLTIPLAAQRAVFVGVVLDSATGLPVSGATVEVLEQGIVAVTDSGGGFRLDGVGGGHFTIYFQRLGYSPGTVGLEFAPTGSMTVDLGEIAVSPVATELDPVVVEGEVFNERLREVGFFGRRHTEAGTFITHEDIVKQNPTNTSELLRRVPGFRVFVDGTVASARGVPGISQGFSQCGVHYYIDGVHADGSDLDTVLPRAIAGLEIYTGSASIPPNYRVIGNPKCGVVLIWTHRGGRAP